MSDVQLTVVEGDVAQVIGAIPGPQGPAGAVAAAIDGSAALPSIAFASDTDTGLYRVGANQLGVSTGGTQRLVVDANGQIEATSLGTAAAPTWTFVGDPDTGAYSPGANQFAISTGGTGRLFISSTGNVGIGTTSPEALLHISSSVITESRITATGSGGRTWRIGTGDTTSGLSGGLRIYDETGTATRVFIDSTGNLGIGTASPGYKLDIASDAAGSALRLRGGSGGSSTVQFTDNAISAQWGTIVTTSSSLDIGHSGIVRLSPGGTEKVRLDSNGRLLVGTASSRAASGLAAILQAETTGYGAMSLVQNSADAGGCVITIGKTRSATVGGSTVVQNGDNIATIYFNGADGSGLSSTGASIAVNVDGTPGASDMPGRLMFSTTADGAASPTERMRIDSKGFAKFSNTGSYVGIDCYQLRADTNEVNTFIHSTNAAYTNNIVQVRATKAANSDFSLAYLTTSNGGDIEFNLRGDGNAFADGAWTGGGADYAEYFEWSDSNPSAEDRRGISVVLDGDKIREAQLGEDPIGVISGNPSVVGDAAWNKWSGKYLRDEYGTYIQEDYEVEDDDGNIVVQQRRKLNPAYDPDVEYISREERPEWDCVGLMGKLRIRKGQITGSRWIKMRDINDSVEEWLVR